MTWSSDNANVPAPLVAGVNWWLNDHPEDVVAVTEDGQDALILSGFNNVDAVAWVNPEGSVHVIKAPWLLVHYEDDEEEDDGN